MRDITAEDMERTKRIVLGMNITRYMDIDDAIQEGMIGLIHAARTYDPAKGPFESHAAHRIRGALRDARRIDDHLTRRHRLKVNAGTVADESAPGHLEADEHWADRFASCDDGDIALRLTLRDAIVRIDGPPGVVLRWWLMDVPHAEMAEFFGLHKSRISQLLREALDGIAAMVGRDTLRGD